MRTLNGRDNLLERSAEPFRPPTLLPATDRRSWFNSRLRRFLDLQSGSIWRDLSELLPNCAGTVLDVGCGAQPYRQLFDGARTRYLAIDQEDALAHFGYHAPDTTYYRGDAWPVADASVEAALSTETLEHVAQPELLLEEARRCLKPGGLLILTAPFSARWHYIPHDYWRFTPSGLQRLLERASFDVVAVHARGNAVTVACYKGMALILPLAATTSPTMAKRVLSRLAAVLLAPILLILAVIGQLSLRSRGGNDCLGYTVIATRQSPPRKLSAA